MSDLKDNREFEEKEAYNGDNASLTEDGGQPTQFEQDTLRHIGDKIPYSAWLVAVVELAERFTYYGLTGPFRK
jgi:proton-dependent oligopeptide transporter, POT family